MDHGSFSTTDLQVPHFIYADALAARATTSREARSRRRRSPAGQDQTRWRWPTLPELALSNPHQQDRQLGIGGSDANIILSGNGDRIRRLWQEKRGEAPPEDLSGVLPVMLGCWTEDFNRQWFEQLEGSPVTRVGRVTVSRDLPWRRCTLDGFVEVRGAVFEAKHVGGFAKPEEVLARYMPQLQHNMAVVKADRALLSVIFGNHKWELFEVAADWLYQDELLAAERRFWDCVQTGEEPLPAPVPGVPKPVGVREMCLDGNNAWAVAAADWLEHRHAARRHATAVTTLKSLVEADVTRAFGHGVEVRRSKAGALSIRELQP